MFIIVIFLKLFINGRCDWVEIPQLNDAKPPTVEISSTTTPSHYEVLMKTTTALTNSTTSTLSSSSTLDFQTDHPISDQNETEINENETDDEDEDNGSSDENSQNNGFLSFLSSIQKNLVKPNLKSVQSKISVLKKLRDDLLIDIDNRMTKLFKSESSGREARGRSHHDDDHDVEFPSNEGALMTIGFLTFAVFLIKLVLKLVYALKHKNNNNGTVMTATTYTGRKRRDLLYDDGAKILQMIEEFSLKN